MSSTSPAIDYTEVIQLLEQAETLESIYNTLVWRNNIDRTVATTLAKHGLAIPTLSIESYTAQPTTVNLQLTLEGLRERAVAIFKAIIEYLDKQIRRFVAWLKSKFSAAESKERSETLNQFDRYLRIYKTTIALQRDFIGEVFALASADAGAITLIRKTMDNVIMDNVRDPNDLPKNPIDIGSSNHTRAPTEPPKAGGAFSYSSVGLYDHVLSLVSSSRIHRFVYECMESVQSDSRKYIDVLLDEVERRVTDIISDCKAAVIAIKNDAEPTVTVNDEADNAFVELALKYLRGVTTDAVYDAQQGVWEAKTKVVAAITNRLSDLCRKDPDLFLTTEFIQAIDGKGFAKLSDTNQDMYQTIDQVAGAIAELKRATGGTKLNPTQQQTEQLKAINAKSNAFMSLTVQIDMIAQSVSSVHPQLAKITGLMHGAFYAFTKGIVEQRLLSPEALVTLTERHKAYTTAYEHGFEDMKFKFIKFPDIVIDTRATS